MVPSCHGKKHCIGTSRAAIGWRKRGGVFMLSIALYLLTHAMLLSPVGRLVPAPALGTGGKEIR